MKKKKNTPSGSGKRKKIFFPVKKAVFFICLAALLAGVCFYFFAGKSEETLIREQFEGLVELLNKEKKEGVIVAAANMQKIGGFFSPVTHIEIDGLPWMNGAVDREDMIRHAFRSRSMFERLRIGFVLHEYGIHGKNATVLFTVNLTGTLKSGDRISEARELEAVLNKESGKWLFQTCRINELIKK